MEYSVSSMDLKRSSMRRGSIDFCSLIVISNSSRRFSNRSIRFSSCSISFFDIGCKHFEFVQEGRSPCFGLKSVAKVEREYDLQLNDCYIRADVSGLYRSICFFSLDLFHFRAFIALQGAESV